MSSQEDQPRRHIWTPIPAGSQHEPKLDLFLQHLNPALHADFAPEALRNAYDNGYNVTWQRENWTLANLQIAYKNFIEDFEEAFLPPSQIAYHEMALTLTQMAELGNIVLSDDRLTPEQRQTLLDTLANPRLASRLPVQTPRRPVDEEPCGICKEDIEKEEDADYCDFGCGKNLHRECITTWLRANGNSATVPCPFCRRPWRVNINTEVDIIRGLPHSTPEEEEAAGLNNVQRQAFNVIEEAEFNIIREGDPPQIRRTMLIALLEGARAIVGIIPASIIASRENDNDLIIENEAARQELKGYITEITDGNFELPYSEDELARIQHMIDFVKGHIGAYVAWVSEVQERSMVLE